MMLFYWGKFNLIKYNKVDGIIKMTTSSSFKLWLYARYSFAIHFLVFLSKRPNMIVDPKIFYQLFIIFFRIGISGIRILRWAVHFSKTLIDHFISCTHIVRSILTSESESVCNFHILWFDWTRLKKMYLTHSDKVKGHFPSLFLSILGINSSFLKSSAMNFYCNVRINSIPYQLFLFDWMNEVKKDATLQ